MISMKFVFPVLNTGLVSVDQFAIEVRSFLSV